MWDRSSGEVLLCTEDYHKDSVVDVRFNMNDSLVATCGYEGSIGVWRKDKLVHSLGSAGKCVLVFYGFVSLSKLVDDTYGHLHYAYLQV